MTAGDNPQHEYISQSVKQLLVCLPVKEQRAIAAALSDADEWIASLDRLIAKKRDIKQAAMQQLLTGKTRLPGFRASWQTRSIWRLLASSGRRIRIHESQLLRQRATVMLALRGIHPRTKRTLTSS